MTYVYKGALSGAKDPWHRTGAAGIPLALEDMDWGRDAWNVLVSVAKTGEVFDAYALESKYGLRPPPKPSSMWGPLFQAANKAGVITYVEHRRSQRPASNGSMRAHWRGLPNGKATK